MVYRAQPPPSRAAYSLPKTRRHSDLRNLFEPNARVATGIFQCNILYMGRKMRRMDTDINAETSCSSPHQKHRRRGTQGRQLLMDIEPSSIHVVTTLQLGTLVSQSSIWVTRYAAGGGRCTSFAKPRVQSRCWFGSLHPSAPLGSQVNRTSLAINCGPARRRSLRVAI